jgi:hypothetical protein
MATIPARNVLWKIVCYQQLDNQEIQNVWYFTNFNAFDDSQLQANTVAAVNEFDANVRVLLQHTQATSLLWKKSVCTCIIPLLGPVAEIAYPITEIGDNEGSALPTFIAAVMKKSTGLSGRSNRGRFYFAGLTEADVFEDALGDTAFDRYLTLRQHVLQQWGGTFASSNLMNLVLYSHKVGDLLGVPSLFGMRAITDLIVRRQVYTQRHRLVGHGN